MSGSDEISGDGLQVAEQGSPDVQPDHIQNIDDEIDDAEIDNLDIDDADIEDADIDDAEIDDADIAEFDDIDGEFGEEFDDDALFDKPNGQNDDMENPVARKRKRMEFSDEEDENELFGSQSGDDEKTSERAVSEARSDGAQSNGAKTIGGKSMAGQTDVGWEDMFGATNGQQQDTTVEPTPNGIDRRMNHFEQTLHSLKKKRKTKEVPAAQAQAKMQILVEEMNHAGHQDQESNRKNEPAIAKMRMLDKVSSELNKAQWQEWFVTSHGCDALALWLNPLPDGSEPNLTLRNKILKIVSVLPISQSALRNSGLSILIKKIYTDPHETKDNRKMAQSLIQKWLRGIFGQSVSYQRQRSDTQMELESISEKVQPAIVSKEQRLQDQAASNKRRHPTMFQKPDLQYKVQPRFHVEPLNDRPDPMSSKGKLIRSLRDLTAPSKKRSIKHAHVSIEGRAINLTF